MLRRWLTGRALLAAVSIGFIVAGLAGMIEIPMPDRPSGSWEDLDRLKERDDLNVVFVMIDTLRSDRLGAYGYERDTGPTFDTLAESGIRFTNVMAQSTWTKTSMASQWTSTYPVTNGITRYPHGLPKKATTAAEILQDEGYRTVGIWRNGWVAPNFGFEQGFDLYYRPKRRGQRDRPNNPSAFSLPGTDQDLTRAAIEFLRGAGSERFFLYLHYMDVHQYVYNDAVDFGTTYSDIYDNSIHWVDQNLESLVATLQKEGLMKRTILVVSSDHGEAFGEHGTEGHARNLYRETTRVPLLVTLPTRLEEGIRVDTPVENVDLWPTIFDLMGLSAIPNAQGRSLVPLVEASARGESPKAEQARFAFLDQTWGRRDTEPDPLYSIAQDGYRLFHSPGPPARTELYHVESDPYEQENIASEHPELVASLVERLEERAATASPSWGGPDEVALDDMELEQLRALGYAVGGEEPEDREELEEDAASSAGGGAPGDRP